LVTGFYREGISVKIIASFRIGLLSNEVRVGFEPFLRQVLDLAAALVPRDVPDDEHSLRHICQASRAGAWSPLQDRLAHVQQDPQRAMKDDAEPLKGNVEIDETGVHGRPRGPKMTLKEAAQWRERQVSVRGMGERGGRVKLRVIESRRGEPLSGAVRANVNPERSSSRTIGAPTGP
jgi:hypothetical protein